MALIKRSLLLGATVVAAAVSAVCLLDFLLLRPLQAAGSLDSLAVIVNVLVTIIALPGLLVGRALYLSGHHLPAEHHTAYALVVTAVTAVTIWLLAFVVLSRRARRCSSDPEITARRSFMRRALSLGALGGVAGLGGYAVLVEPRWCAVRRLRFALRGLPSELAGLKAVQLTDLHLGRFNSAAYLRGVVARCNALEPDLVLLTGDYVHGSVKFIPAVAAILGRLRSRLGSFAVLGNHDHWEDAALTRRELRKVGVRLLDNGRLFISSAGVGAVPPVGGGLCLAGVGDLWEDRVDLEAALGGVDPSLPRILLSHNPDFAETHQARTGPRVDLMLAGHTHGGQVCLPGVGTPIVPSRHGSKYARGLVRGPRFPVFVSAGLGTTILPLRMNVRPEVVLIELQRRRRQI
jgi:uncharacterized protein